MQAHMCEGARLKHTKSTRLLSVSLFSLRTLTPIIEGADGEIRPAR